MCTEPSKMSQNKFHLLLVIPDYLSRHWENQQHLVCNSKHIFPEILKILESRGVDFCLIVVENTREYGQLWALIGHLGTLGHQSVIMRTTLNTSWSQWMGQHCPTGFSFSCDFLQLAPSLFIGLFNVPIVTSYRRRLRSLERFSHWNMISAFLTHCTFCL